MQGQWVVVRCHGQKTLDQVLDFTAQGVRAWTPTWRRRKRLPRTRKTQVVLAPCLPSYVFVGEEHLGLLNAMHLGGKLKGRVMRMDDGSVIRIQDGQLQGLRETSDFVEDEGPKVPRPKIGSTRRIVDGPFAGLTGQVVGVGRTCALVSFGEGFNIPAQIPYSLLSMISVGG